MSKDLTVGVVYLCLAIVFVVAASLVRRIVGRSGAGVNETAWGVFFPGAPPALRVLTDRLAFSLFLFVFSGFFWVTVLPSLGVDVPNLSRDAFLALTLIIGGNYVVAMYLNPRGRQIRISSESLLIFCSLFIRVEIIGLGLGGM